MIRISVSETLRKFVRNCIVIALICCAILDVALGEAAISGTGDVAYWDQGNLVFPHAQPELWLPIFGFVVVQGVLVFALIRLREPGRSPASPLTFKNLL